MFRASLAVLLLAASLVAQTYTPLFLDSNNKASSGLAVSISRTGDLAAGTAVPVVGTGWGSPARWTSSGTQFLPILAGDEAGGGYGINDVGTVVGESIDVVQQHQLIIFTSRGVAWIDGQVVLLSDLATSGDTDIEPFAGLALNNHGQTLGWGKRDGVDGLRGFLLEDGVMTDLGSLQGTITGSTEPYDLNEQGTAVGSSAAPDFFNHAFVWQDGVMTDLHVSSGVIGRNSHAASINEFGVIVGDADPTADFLDYQNAALWQDGVVTYLPDLGDVGGVIESYARDVNDHGTIVGTSVTPNFEVHAVMWVDGQVTDLNTLIPPGSGWLLANAYAIGNDGRIVGEGFSLQGLEAFVLVPDSDGGFEVYGAGCAGSEAFVPGLWGQGDPVGGGSLSLALTNGLGGAPGLLLLGLGDQSAPFKGCTLHVLPLSPLSVPLFLTPGGAGGGQWALEATLPASVSAGSLYLQALLADAGAPSGVSVTNALRLDVAP